MNLFENELKDDLLEMLEATAKQIQNLQDEIVSCQDFVDEVKAELKKREENKL